MKALIARANSPSSAFAIFFTFLLVALPVIYGPIVGLLVIGAMAALAALIFAPEVGAFVSRIAEAAYRSRVRIIVGAACLTLGVLALLALGGAAHAAEAAASPTVTIPWGDWLAAGLGQIEGLVVTIVATAGARTGIPVLAAWAAGDAAKKAVHYVLATEAGLVAGKTIELGSLPPVVALAANWAKANAPFGAKVAGDNLLPLIVAELSKAGVLPAESTAKSLGLSAS